MCGGAEARRLENRVAEVVAFVGCDLTAAQADAQAESTARRLVVAIDALLHGDCARQASRRGREDHHEPVSSVLDLAPRRFPRSARRSEEKCSRRTVSAASGRQRSGELCRPNQVREEHGEVLGGRRHVTSDLKTSAPVTDRGGLEQKHAGSSVRARRPDSAKLGTKPQLRASVPYAGCLWQRAGRERFGRRPIIHGSPVAGAIWAVSVPRPLSTFT